MADDYAARLRATHGDTKLWKAFGDILESKTARTRSYTHSGQVPQRYEPLFTARARPDTELVGIHLSTTEWAGIFVGLLRECQEALDAAPPDAPHGTLLRKVPDPLLLLLFKCAAHCGGWQAPPEIESQWRRVRDRIDDLSAADRAWWRRRLPDH